MKSSRSSGQIVKHPRPAGLQRLAACLLWLGLLLSPSAFAETLQLAWDPVVDQRVEVYEVHYGTTPGQYTLVVSSTTASATLDNLSAGQTYFLAVRACDAARALCSDFSNEISATVASPPAPAPVASFNLDNTSGYAPLSVLFSDTSTGEISTRAWQFGDGATSNGASTITHSFTEPGTYNVQLTVTGPGGTDSTIQTITVLAQSSGGDGTTTGGDGTDGTTTDGNGDTTAGGSDTFIEVGEFDLDHQWQRVDFARPFVDPVVIVKPLSANGDHPSVVRIDGITPTGFMVRAQEWDYLDGTHTVETANYLVVERGRHQLSNGAWIEAGSVQTAGTGTFDRVPLSAPFTQAPIVLTSVNSVNEADAVTTRLHNIGPSGFDVQLQEQEVYTNGHAPETVAFVAWEPSSGTVDGRRFEAGRTGIEVTHASHRLTYPAAFDVAPIFLADMQSTYGGDTANLRWLNKTVFSVDVWVDEEKSANREVTHVAEQVGYLLFDTVANNTGTTGGDSDTGTEPPTTEPPVTPPTAAFTLNSTSGVAPLTVLLTDTSTGSITGRTWQLGDGSSSGDATLVTHTYTNPGSYSVQLTVTGPNGSDSVAQTLTVLADTTTGGDTTGGDTTGGDTTTGGTSNGFLEVGEFELDHQWQRIDFAHTFVDPVVIVKPLSAIGDDPSVVRIEDVTPTGFMVRVQEWDYLNGTHYMETASYLVVERGRHQLPNGAWIEADTVDTAATLARDDVAFSAPFTEVPVVLAGVGTVNELDAVVTRLHNIDRFGFEIQLDEQEAYQQVHAMETVAFIAWEPSTGVIDGRQFEVGRTADVVTHEAHTVGFAHTHALPPIFLADMQSTDGGDTANLRWSNKTTTSVRVWVDEEQSANREIQHTTETVGYIVIGD